MEGVTQRFRIKGIVKKLESHAHIFVGDWIKADDFYHLGYFKFESFLEKFHKSTKLFTEDKQVETVIKSLEPSYQTLKQAEQNSPGGKAFLSFVEVYIEKFGVVEHIDSYKGDKTLPQHPEQASKYLSSLFAKGILSIGYLFFENKLHFEE